ncbi:hypothetical protein [Microseira wollei]|uniref:Uncharacterized protein n=1 Tax=Microseira wollei NIES-4236 TaxID=2530354 RepID=A0AAV3X978_9CYAN|nr:hypothetical protein [Microseira wollei]GET38390.1 hypothetical protein MiSe_31480 [Microseira wollei NIES-4236]
MPTPQNQETSCGVGVPPALQIVSYKTLLSNRKKAVGKTPKAFLVDRRSPLPRETLYQETRFLTSEVRKSCF